MSRVLLSAALIVKDEEKFLGNCLASLKRLVDEVVVVDTGSTDRSREIALTLEARVEDFAWADDFSAARNHALDLVRGEWILYIDADERVRPCSRSALHKHLSSPGLIASYVLLHPRPGFTPYQEVRLFKNDPQIRFRGIIHENIWPGITDYRTHLGGTIGRSPLVIDHDGYEGDQHEKHLRNLPLLQRALEEDPSRVYLWCHLASIQLAQEQEDLAERSWRKALELVRKKRWSLAEDCLPYVGLIQRGLAKVHEDVEGLLKEALERFPRNLQLLWLQGRFLMGVGRFSETIPVLERLVTCGLGGDFDSSMAYDTRLFTVSSFEALGACHFKLGNYRTARDYLRLAGRCDPDRLEYRVKSALCSQLAGRQSDGPEARTTDPTVALVRKRLRALRDGG